TASACATAPVPVPTRNQRATAPAHAASPARPGPAPPPRPPTNVARSDRIATVVRSAASLPRNRRPANFGHREQWSRVCAKRVKSLAPTDRLSRASQAPLAGIGDWEGESHRGSSPRLARQTRSATAPETVRASFPRLLGGGNHARWPRRLRYGP